MTAAQTHRVAGDALRAVDAHKDHFVVLAALAEFGPASQSALAGRARIYKSDLVSVLNDLADGGWIRRRPDAADTRRNVITIIPSGKRRLATLDRILETVNNHVMAPLTPDERSQLFNLLTRINTHLATPEVLAAARRGRDEFTSIPYPCANCRRYTDPPPVARRVVSFGGVRPAVFHDSATGPEPFSTTRRARAPRGANLAWSLGTGLRRRAWRGWVWCGVARVGVVPGAGGRGAGGGAECECAVRAGVAPGAGRLRGDCGVTVARLWRGWGVVWGGVAGACAPGKVAWDERERTDAHCPIVSRGRCLRGGTDGLCLGSEGVGSGAPRRGCCTAVDR